MKQNVMVVTNKKELLVAFKKSYFSMGKQESYYIIKMVRQSTKYIAH